MLSGVCNFQILGVERYDQQIAVVYRMLEVLGPEGPDGLKSIAPFMAGPEMSSTELSDDRGTSLRKKGGSAGGGGGERVGRIVFESRPTGQRHDSDNQWGRDELRDPAWRIS